MLTTTAAAFAFTASPSTRPSVACRADPQMCGIMATVNSKLSPESLRLQTLTLVVTCLTYFYGILLELKTLDIQTSPGESTAQANCLLHDKP